MQQTQWSWYGGWVFPFTTLEVHLINSAISQLVSLVIGHETDIIQTYFELVKSSCSHFFFKDKLGEERIRFLNQLFIIPQLFSEMTNRRETPTSPFFFSLLVGFNSYNDLCLAFQYLQYRLKEKRAKYLPESDYENA